MNNRQTFRAALLVAAVFASAGANAEIKWQFYDVVPPSGYGNSLTYTGNTVGSANVTATAWSNTGGTSNTVLEDAYLGSYGGGLGVTNRDQGTGDPNESTSPEHSVDNNDRFDSVLFTFDSAVQVTQVEVGWWQTDSDISVLAYTGVGTPTLAGNSYTNLTSSGWTLVGHYSNLGTNIPQAVNAGGLVSSYWVVGAYNPTVGNSQGWTINNDNVKLLALYGNQPPPPPNEQAPLPGTAALMLSGVLGMTGARRLRRWVKVR